MNTCPCCSEKLLRHARHNTIYWFCPHCWQEMPNLSATLLKDRKPLLQVPSMKERVELAR